MNNGIEPVSSFGCVETKCATCFYSKLNNNLFFCIYHTKDCTEELSENCMEWMEDLDESEFYEEK